MPEEGRSAVEESQADQEVRFRALYEAHYGAVVAYARRRALSAEDGQEAVAETFTVAWRRLADVPAGDGALPWLYGVARRVLANQRRGNRRRANLSARLTGRRPEAPDLEEDLVSAGERQVVLDALGRLKEADQEILRLAVWEELSHRRIARALGCAEATVAVRLHRARNRLGHEIEKGECGPGQIPERGPDGRAGGQP